MPCYGVRYRPVQVKLKVSNPRVVLLAMLLQSLTDGGGGYINGIYLLSEPNDLSALS